MKKLFYTLGATLAVATPIIAVVSCGPKDKKIGQKNDQVSILDYATDESGNKYPIHSTTFLGEKMSSLDVEQHLKDNLSFKDPSQWHFESNPVLDKDGQPLIDGSHRKVFFNWEGAERFGDQEIAFLNLDNDGSWAKSGKEFGGKYITGCGFARFGSTSGNRDFQILTNIYPKPDANNDYSTMNVAQEFIIIDDKFAAETPARTFEFGEKQVPKASVASVISEETAGSKTQQANEAIIALTNTYKALNENQRKMLDGYFSKSDFDDFTKYYLQDNVQQFLRTNIDNVRIMLEKYPAIDVPKLIEQKDGFTNPKTSSWIRWLSGDDWEKKNVFLGIKVLSWYLHNHLDAGGNARP